MAHGRVFGRYCVQMRGRLVDDAPPERYRDAFDHTRAAMVLVDAEGVIVRANKALEALIGRDVRKLVGRDARELLAPGDRDRSWVAEGTAFSFDGRCQRADGSTLPVRLDVTVAGDGYLFGQFTEIPDREYDPVTGLPERGRFDAALAQHAAHVRRYGADGALLVLSLDDFADLGEKEGDRVLRDVASALRRRLRTTDLISRTAGSFRVLVPRGTCAEAMIVARDARDEVRRAVGLSCSIAVAPLQDPDDPVALQQRAGAALHEVRRTGGDGVAAALPAPSAK